MINLSEAADKAHDLQRRDRFERHLDWFTSLPGWYVHYAPTFDSTYAFDTLADIPAKTGLILVYVGAWPEKAVKCAEAAFSITKAMLEKGKERHGYDEPRHMLATCYMGVLARAKQDVMVVNAVVNLVREFEERYRATYFPAGTPSTHAYGGPYPDQLLHEALRWRDDFVNEKYNGAALGDRSRNIIQELASIADVDRFIFDVWGVIPKYSPVNDELTQIQRRPLMLHLLELLQKKLQTFTAPPAPAGANEARGDVPPDSAS